MNRPLTVTPEDIASFEQSTGFKGIGTRMVTGGIWKLKEESCKKTAMVPPSSTVSKQRERGAPLLSSHS